MCGVLQLHRAELLSLPEAKEDYTDNSTLAERERTSWARPRVRSLKRRGNSRYKAAEAWKAWQGAGSVNSEFSLIASVLACLRGNKARICFCWVGLSFTSSFELPLSIRNCWRF